MAEPLADVTRASLLSHLRQHAARTPHKVAVRVLTDDGSERERLSYRALWTSISSTAHALAARVDPGERVLLLLPTGLDYIVSFLGCLGAGACAVPAFPPHAVPTQAPRALAIAQSAQPRLMLVESGQREADGLRFKGLKSSARIESVCLQELVGVPPVGLTVSDASLPWSCVPDALALLQYTSGSTSEPKGVMVSHANLFANQAAIAHAFGTRSSDVIVSWLPLHHDMGLLGALLQALYVGCELVLLSPGLFTRDPARWLDAITRYRGTVSGGPDFGYRMCLERIPEHARARFDLSSWRLAFTGAEPIREATLAGFARGFAGCGFRDTALFACYGLAEATLLASGSVRNRAPVTRRFDARALEQGALRPCADADGGSVLVGCGRALPEHSLRIAAEGGAALPDGSIGEIWLSGPSVTQGYFGAERETLEHYVEHEGTRYLRTGDMGALLDGELFLAGRHKDLIIVRGRNLFPQDIEHSIESAISVLQKGRVAAFSEQIDGEECVVVAAEVRRDAQKQLREQALVTAICEAVARTHLEAPRKVLLLKPGALPKTSSGKLRRRAAASAFRAGTLGVYAQYIALVRQGEPTTDVAAPQVELTLAEQRIAELWKELLGVAVEQPHASFFALGGNSVLAAQLVVCIEHQLGVRLPLADVFAAPSLRGLAQRIVKAGSRARSPIAPFAGLPLPAAGAASQIMALTAAQRGVWLALERDTQPAAFHLSVSVELAGQLDLRALRHSLQLLMQRHDALRTSLDLLGDEPLQRVHHVLPLPEIYEVDMEPAVRAIGRGEAMRALVECQVERGFPLKAGPLWSCTLGRLDAATSCLVLSAHLLILDGASLGIVLQDLAELYAATCAQRSPRLPVPVTVRELLAAESARASASVASEGELARARALLDPLPLPMHIELPLDRARPAAPSRRAERVTWAVPEPLAAELSALARAEAVPVSVVLLAALSVLLQRHTGAPGVRIGMPIANRQGALAARAVSLCMRTAVMVLPVRPGDQLRELLPLVAAELSHLREQRWLTPELLVRASAPERQAGCSALFDVAFNDQEDWTAHFQQLGTAQVLALDTFTGFTPFDLTLTMQAGPDSRLDCHFEYATDLFDQGTVQRLAADYASVLATLTFDAHAYVGQVLVSASCEREPTPGEYTGAAISDA